MNSIIFATNVEKQLKSFNINGIPYTVSAPAIRTDLNGKCVYSYSLQGQSSEQPTMVYQNITTVRTALQKFFAKNEFLSANAHLSTVELIQIVICDPDNLPLKWQLTVIRDAELTPQEKAIYVDAEHRFNLSVQD